MKILLVSFYYSPEVGAAPTRIANMAEGLKAQGADVDVLTCLPNYPKGKIFDGYKKKFSVVEKINGITTYRYWTYATVAKSALKRGLSMISFASTMWTFAFKRKTIRQYDCVIVQCPPLPVAVSTITLFKKLYGRKVYVNISDLWPLSAVELGAMKEGSKMHSLFLWMERYVYRNAYGIFGQSEEILDHISNFPSPERKFLYRNVKPLSDEIKPHSKDGNIKIVYAGLLGVAQDILGIITNIDFRSKNIEFHLYGGGNQAEDIKNYIKSNPECGIKYHGYVSKEELSEELKKYDASIVPLAVHIRGAVPSKIFDLLPVGLPILFCGGGEGAHIVEQYRVGLTSAPGDYQTLERNINALNEMSAEDYLLLSKNCIKCATEDFNLDTQLKNAYNFLLEK